MINCGSFVYFIGFMKNYVFIDKFINLFRIIGFIMVVKGYFKLSFKSFFLL